MLFGATLGYNWQTGGFVYGLEGDFAMSMVKGSVACDAATCETKNTYLGTARGSVGYAFDRYLPYVIGGVAFGNIKATNLNQGFSTTTASKIGYTFGAGLEYAFMGNWTAKIEYLYVDLAGSIAASTARPPWRRTMSVSGSTSSASA